MKTIKLSIGFLLVITSVLIVYWGVLSNDFLVTWDDDAYVLENPHLNINSTQDVAELFTITYEGNYHPISMLSLALDHAIWGEQSQGYHLTNILLHIANALLVFWLALLLIKHQLSAFFVALLFALHPMHVESVAWVSERKDVLFLFFLLSGLITYLYSQSRKHNRLWYLMTIVLFTLSVLSKPSAIVFPVLLLLLDGWQKEEWRWRLLVNKIPFVLVALTVAGITVFAQGSADAISDLSDYSLWQRVQLVSHSWMTYAYKFFVPINQSGFYGYPPYDVSFPIGFQVAPFVVLLVGVGALLRYRKYKHPVIGLAFFTVALLPVLQIIPVGSAMMAERYTYLPYLGLNLGVMMLLKQFLAQQKQLAVSFHACIVVLVLLFGIKTVDRTAIWQSDETFWTDVLQKDPKTQMAHFGLGNYYYMNGDYEACIQQYKQLLEYYPNDLQGNGFLGFLYDKIDQPLEAIKHLDKVVYLDSLDFESRHIRGVSLLKIGLPEDALADFDHCISYDSDSPHHYIMRADAHLALGQLSLAVADWQQAIELDTEDAKAYYNLGLYYYETQDFENAKEFFISAAVINPEKDKYKKMAALFEEG